MKVLISYLMELTDILFEPVYHEEFGAKGF